MTKLIYWQFNIFPFRRNHPKAFFEQGVLKAWSKFVREHPCRSAISKKLLCIFIEIALRDEYSVNLTPNFKTSFAKNICRWLLLSIATLLKLNQIQISKQMFNKLLMKRRSIEYFDDGKICYWKKLVVLQTQ